jgi:hypothetical protein
MDPQEAMMKAPNQQFEHREHELLGEQGFQSTVTEFARLEAALRIVDLVRFTP